MILSPGVLASSFEMLEIIGRQDISPSQLSLSFPKISVCRTTDTLAVAQQLSWIKVGIGGLLALTESGIGIVSIPKHEDRLLQSILDFIDIFRPPWIQNASFGRYKVLSYAGSETKQVFYEAGLATGTDNRTVEFWDMLSARARGQKEDRLTAIGRRGERLTMQREEKRTGRQPKWVSLDNNADGYDILSIVKNGDDTQLSIEVKATTIGLNGVFHITRTEWNRATTAPFHCFHLWLLQKSSDSIATLAVILPNEMEQHVPKDAGEGKWSTFATPFKAFSKSFK